MRKRTISLWVVAPFLLIGVLFAYIVSPLGAPVIRYVANAAVDGLHIDDIDGTILSDITVSGVNWENEQWSVSVGKAETNLVLGCLITTKVCVDYLTVDGFTLKQLAVSEAEEEPDSEPLTEFELPVSVKLNALTLTDVSIDLLAQQVALKSLSTQGTAWKTVSLSPLKAEGLVVTLPEAPQESEPTDKPASYALSYTAPALPEVIIPIPVTVESFELKDISVKQGDATLQEIPLVAFNSLTLEQSDVALDKLHVEHAMANVDASASVTLAKDYPLNLDATAGITLEGIEETVTLSTDGSLRDLNLDVAVDGTYSAQVAGHANILDDTLPLDLKINWPEQAIPQVENSKLWQGDMLLQGEMGAYRFTADSGADIAEIGAIPVTADVVLNQNDITVNALNVKILEGQVVNTGTLYLNESVSWSGNTKVSDISATQVSPFAPTQINGSLDSLMRLTDKGVEANIRNLSVTGMRDGVPVEVNGGLIYSQGNDILVANLNVSQAESTVRAMVQIFKERYLNADIDLNVAAIDELYPQVFGKVNGKIKAKGEWTDPIIVADITLTDVMASATLSPIAAEQGKVNGTVNAKGTFSDHSFGVDLSLPEHKLQLAMKGAWKDNRYTADISDSQIGLLTTRWQLNQPFRVAVRPEPFSMKVHRNCWESRNEGELCIEDVLYKDERTKWIVNANSVPVGLWAHELLPDTFTATSDAQLSLKTTGEFGVNAPMTANFDVSVTPSTWTMGPEQQLKLNVDTLQAQGNFKNDTLTSTLTLTSEQLGNITADVEMQPTKDDMPLTGKVNIDNIRIAPFKPMSPAIRQLAGNLNGDLQLEGSATAPSVTGQLKLGNGNVDIEDMPVSIGDWEQLITFNGQSADFDGKFLLGNGPGTLSGDLAWSDGFETNIKLKGDRFRVNQPDISIDVSPDISASVKPGEVNVSGSVDIPWARIEIEELPPSAVSPSKDVHLRGEPPTEDPLDMVNANITVNIDEEKLGEVKLEAFGLTANLHGNIEVDTQPSMVAFGSLQILNGRYQAYGQDLVIRTGEVQFNGPIDQPSLLVEAVRDPNKTADGVVAGVRIDGAADSPNIALYSEPSMNQSNTLSYLLTGQGLGSSSSSSSDYGSLLLGFGLSNTENLQNKVGSALGIDEFTVGTTSNPNGGSTKLSINGQINERLTVQYNLDVGLSSDNNTTGTLRRRQEPPDLALRYRLLPRLFVEGVQTTIEEQSVFAVDFYYEFFLGESTPSRSQSNQTTSEEKP